MEVICIDDKFTNEQLDFWLRHGVKHPIEGKIYHIERMQKHTTGEVSVYLLELKDNPLVPVKHPILGVQMMEVGFALRRFTTLLGCGIEFTTEKKKVTNH